MSMLVTALVLSQPYVRTFASADEHAPCLWWLGPSVEIRQNSAGNPTTGPTAMEAVSAGVRAWSDGLRCSMLSLVEGSKTPTRRVGAMNSGTNINLILFRARSCAKVAPMTHACWKDASCGNTFDCWEHASALLGTTVVTYDVETGQVFDADIELNAADNTMTTVDSPICQPGAVSQRCVATDIQNTVTHEVGHLLGLAHTALPGSTMNASSVMGERSKRSLDEGSRTFLCSAYSTETGPDDCVISAVGEQLGPAAATGCSSSGSLTPLAVAVTLLLRRWRRASLLALALSATTGQASTVRPLAFPELIAQSNSVFRGNVIGIESRWAGDGLRIITLVTIAVTETWKGLPASRQTVVVPGGVVGRIGQRVEGAPHFKLGEDVALFVEERGPAGVITGFSQGAFSIAQNRATQRSFHQAEMALLSLPVNALREAVITTTTRQGADSNRALPLALPTQIKR